MTGVGRVPGDPGVREDANEGLSMVESHHVGTGHRWDDAMRRAIELAANGPAVDPNPRVGCVLLGPDGAVLGQGWHHGAGTPHAEIQALRDAGVTAGRDRLTAGCTAVVTLEPCNHTGRTGPCSRALIAAGVQRVVIGQSDPNPVAAGGAQTLAEAGIEVVGEVLTDQARALNPDWTFSMVHGRPRVVWKYAATLDGRSAAQDGTSRWITSDQARARVHLERSRCAAVMVGTGTALADDPRLTVRGVAVAHQPLRVVVGRRPLPPGSHLLDDSAPMVQITSHDPQFVLAELQRRGVHRVWLEGGPRLAGAFCRAGLIDEVIAHIAPTLLGSGPAALADAGVSTIDEAHRLVIGEVSMIGPDIEIRAHPIPREPPAPVPPAPSRSTPGQSTSNQSRP